ncbi:MAG: CoA transferase subunit A [Dethiobacter sp.]|nr:CoA transferase subunit A [Dethiobacter sp.]
MTMKMQDYAVKKAKEVVYTPIGERRLFSDPDADLAREYFQHKSRRKVDKTTTVAEAVTRLVSDGAYMGVGGFGTNRIPTAVLHEIVRRRKKNLGLSGHTATHDFQILVAGKCIDRCDVAYIIGLEARGLSKRARLAVEQGEIEITEWTNAALAWRYKAAAMGISFIPARCMLGTDTAKYSAAVEMECPFTEKKYLALPALFPDLAMIHVHRADVYGNCQIDGIMVSDFDLARASKRLIITTERLVPEEVIRREPQRTVIPYYLVDAVIEVPYGAYPGNMAYEYYSDEEHLQEWLQADQSPETLDQFLQRNIYGVKDFGGYLEINGGMDRMARLRRQETLLEK